MRRIAISAIVQVERIKRKRFVAKRSNHQIKSCPILNVKFTIKYIGSSIDTSLLKHAYSSAGCFIGHFKVK